jgi:hypothetical protein
MKCDSKMMVKTAVGVSVLLAAAYVALPGLRPWLVASIPFLLFLLCPLSMFFMMKMMVPGNKEEAPAIVKSEALSATATKPSNQS